MSPHVLRKPTVRDVAQIVHLIRLGVKRGTNLPRSQSYIFQNLRDFVVVEENGEIVGCAALHVLWEDIAEVRAAAVASTTDEEVILRHMIDYFVRDGRHLGVRQILAFAFKPEPFVRLGFREVKKESLPQIAWRECINCVHFPGCKETALILNIETDGRRRAD